MTTLDPFLSLRRSCHLKSKLQSTPPIQKHYSRTEKLNNWVQKRGKAMRDYKTSASEREMRRGRRLAPECEAARGKRRAAPAVGNALFPAPRGLHLTRPTRSNSRHLPPRVPSHLSATIYQSGLLLCTIEKARQAAATRDTVRSVIHSLRLFKILCLQLKQVGTLMSKGIK